MQKILNIDFINKENRTIPRLYFLGMSHKFNSMDFSEKNVIFYWKEIFDKYFEENNIEYKINNLKNNQDKISCEYVDNFIKLYKYIGKPYFKNPWTKYDRVLFKKLDNFLKTFKQPFADILKINTFSYMQVYGLCDLPKDVFEQINGKIIIDGGALNGDTAIIFHNYFPNSPVHAYEPLTENFKEMEKFLEVDNCNNKIIPIKKGLSNKEQIIEIKYNYTETAQVVPIDKEYQNSSAVGLIKLDTEGYESNIIEGAKEIIKRDKPVLVVAIYHTPEDFFELKDKIKSLNPDYKFMVRRSEPIIPMADLILIAY